MYKGCLPQFNDFTITNVEKTAILSFYYIHE